MNQGPLKTGGFTGNLPAFPVLNLSELRPETLAEFERLSSGMTMRQYAAIHSPVSMIDANESLHQTAQFGKPSDRDAFPIHQVIAESVRLSVMYADLLMAELAKGQDAPVQPQSLSDKDPA